MLAKRPVACVLDPEIGHHWFTQNEDVGARASTTRELLWVGGSIAIKRQKVRPPTGLPHVSVANPLLLYRTLTIPKLGMRPLFGTLVKTARHEFNSLCWCYVSWNNASRLVWLSHSDLWLFAGFKAL